MTTKNTAGTMTTFSVRCWSGQLDRIKAAAEREGKNPPEWILDHLMPATGDTLGDTPPLFPEIKRRPSVPPVADTPVARLAAKLNVDAGELRAFVLAAVREAGGVRPDHSTSGMRKVEGNSRH